LRPCQFIHRMKRPGEAFAVPDLFYRFLIESLEEIVTVIQGDG
jgi:hypothetical protein